MSGISGTVRGGEQIVARFQNIGGGVRERMLAILDRFSTSLEGYIKTDKLSGQVLNRRSGRLSNAVNSRVESTASRVSGIAGVNLQKAAYGRAHEYGYTGSVTVPAHTRMLTMVFGKSVSPRTINVRGHSMFMRLPERSYMRSSLRDKGPEGVEMVRAGLLDLIKEHGA